MSISSLRKKLSDLGKQIDFLHADVAPMLRCLTLQPGEPMPPNAEDDYALIVRLHDAEHPKAF